MCRRRASVQDGQAFTSAWWRHCFETVFRDNFVIFRRRSKRIAFLESVNFSPRSVGENPSSNLRSWSWSISRSRSETACIKGCRCVLLPSASTTPDSLSRRHGSHRPARACTHRLQTGLLQHLLLSVSWRAAVYSQRTAACPERCSSADFQSRAARPRQRQSDRTALAADPLAHTI